MTDFTIATTHPITIPVTGITTHTVDGSKNRSNTISAILKRVARGAGNELIVSCYSPQRTKS